MTEQELVQIEMNAGCSITWGDRTAKLLVAEVRWLKKYVMEIEERNSVLAEAHREVMEAAEDYWSAWQEAI